MMLRPMSLCLLAMLLGMAIGASVVHIIESRALFVEKAARARDNQQHANELNAISKAVFATEQRAITAHRVAETKIAALAAQLIQERRINEANNARYRAAIADGRYRLRVIVFIPAQPVSLQSILAPVFAPWSMAPVVQPSYHDRLESLSLALSTRPTPTRAPKPIISDAISMSCSNRE